MRRVFWKTCLVAGLLATAAPLAEAKPVEVLPVQEVPPHMQLPERQARDAALTDLINRYNAIVRTAPPRQPGWLGFTRYFFLDKHDVYGEALNLRELENRIRKFGDARIHFALNCGASSCPPIREYEAEALDSQLDLATRSYLNQPSGVRIDEARRTVYLSQLFEWYRRDFGPPLVFIRPYLDAPAREALDRLGPSTKIAFIPWDWTPAGQ